jgi:peptidoglycan/xylan/chitin deacetylase (PgdA/CDA1 family)
VIRRAALALASRGRLSILIFHRVLREPDALLPSEPTVLEFDTLLTHLKRHYTILPLTDAIDRLYSGSLPSGAVAITFDDGYADNLAVAAPVLRKHAVPATIFIATGYLDGGVMWNDLVIEAFRSAERQELDLNGLGLGTHLLACVDDRRSALDRVLNALKLRPASEREALARRVADTAGVRQTGAFMLTSGGVRALAAFGIDVGAHTVSHPILATTHPDEAWREISESKRTLEHLIGRPVTVFAYPNGRPDIDYSVEHAGMARDAGFSAALSTAWGTANRSTDRMQLPRFTPWTRKPFKFDLQMLTNFRRLPRHASAGSSMTPAPSVRSVAGQVPADGNS